MPSFKFLKVVYTFKNKGGERERGKTTLKTKQLDKGHKTPNRVVFSFWHTNSSDCNSTKKSLEYLCFLTESIAIYVLNNLTYYNTSKLMKTVYFLGLTGLSFTSISIFSLSFSTSFAIMTNLWSSVSYVSYLYEQPDNVSSLSLSKTSV